MFSISELACASSSGIVLIKTAGFGINAIAWRRAANAALAFTHALRIVLVSISTDGGRSGRSLYGLEGSKLICRKLSLFSTLDHRNVDCLDKGRGLNTSFPNWRCLQICPRPQLAATERQWTSTGVKTKFLVEIRSDFPRLSHRSGRSWTSLNAIGWWAV